ALATGAGVFGSVATGGGRAVVGNETLLFGDVDTSGHSQLLDGCRAAACELTTQRNALAALPADVSLGAITVASGDSVAIEAPASSQPVVIDLDSVALRADA